MFFLNYFNYDEIEMLNHCVMKFWTHADISLSLILFSTVFQYDKAGLVLKFMSHNVGIKHQRIRFLIVR